MATSTRSAGAERRKRGGVLLAGAVVLAVLLAGVDGSQLVDTGLDAGPLPLPFYWLPLLTGLTYLGAAAVGGKRGALWAPGLVVTGWGVGVLLTLSGRVDGELFTALSIVGLGVGAVAVALLGRAGFAVGELGIALSVLLAGVFFLLTQRGPVATELGETLPYVVLLGLWGLWELRPGAA